MEPNEGMAVVVSKPCNDAISNQKPQLHFEAQQQRKHQSLRIFTGTLNRLGSCLVAWHARLLQSGYQLCPISSVANVGICVWVCVCLCVMKQDI